MIGLISGTGLYDPTFLGDVKEERVKTDYGEAEAYLGDGFMLILRHGKSHLVPPHMINHRGNIAAFRRKGVNEIISITSVGGLKKEYAPGRIVIPSDYMQLCNVPTYFDKQTIHTTPCLDDGLRKRMKDIASKLNIEVIDKGVYFQTHGPRLETKAEINYIKDYADVVGMTMASEATLANELAIKYASISSVDNYANGLCKEMFDFKEVMEKSHEKKEDIKKIITRIVEESK